MSDVVVGPDGKARCAWAGADDSLVRYHDKVWGKRTYDESALFEALTLGVFQAGLSWEIVFRKREAFQKVFHGFDVAKVARMTSRDVDRLVDDASIIRNRAKIEATIANARAAADVDDLSELLWSFAPAPRPRPVDISKVPAVTPESTAMARELKRRGFRFVGPTTAYALMQATGMVDDHLRACWVPAVGDDAAR